MLSPDHISKYHDLGYAVCPQFLDSDTLAELLAELDGVVAGQSLADHDEDRIEMEPGQDPAGNRIRRVKEPCSRYPAFIALAESDRLLDAVEKLIGPNIMFHYSKINMKPPEVGSVVEWHQDLSYYPLTNPDSMAVLIYLDDADFGNGCLRVIPGGSKEDLMDHTHDGYFQGRVTEDVDESRAVDVEGAAGTVTFMHCMTPHASRPNRSERARRTLIISYRASDAFPIHVGPGTTSAEMWERVVRGRSSAAARFTFDSFPIPMFKHPVGSLYDLQAQAREETGE